ncbi:hypothetical protein D3C80_671500 [compost metagenome]
MAADVEKVVFGADIRRPQYLAPNSGNDLPAAGQRLCCRRLIRAGKGKQRGLIGFTIGIDRHAFHHQEAGGQEV